MMHQPPLTKLRMTATGKARSPRNQLPRNLCFPRARVGYCVADPEGSAAIVRAINDCGAITIRLTPDALRQQAPLVGGLDALVYDLEPWDSTAVDIMVALREARPSLPILLCLPPAPIHPQLLISLGSIPGLVACNQYCDSTKFAGLREQVTSLLTRVPCCQLRALVLRVCGNLPQPVVAFVDVALTSIRERMGRSGQDLRVLTLANQSRSELRHLEQICRDLHLPTPKRLMDWTRYLFVNLEALEAESSVCRVAASLGIDSNALYRMRRRLHCRTCATGPRAPENEFEISLGEFANPCHAPDAALTCFPRRAARADGDTRAAGLAWVAPQRTPEGTAASPRGLRELRPPAKCWQNTGTYLASHRV